MSKKGKGKEKGGKKRTTTAPTFEEKEKLAEVDRAFYELTIQDAKKKILTLRNHIQNLLVSNDNIVEELHVITEGKVNQSVDLEKAINEIEDNIIHLRSENATLTENFNTEKRETDETISDLELKYRLMHDQLSAEVKRLNGHLHACGELRKNWDNWMVKFTERVDEIGETQRNAEENLREIAKKTIYENKMLKEDLLSKLTLAGEEFTGAGSTNSSDFNMRLIRENIALQKSIDILTNSNNEMDMQMQQELETYESNKANIPKLEKKNSELVLESQEILHLINRLTDQVLELKKECTSMMSYREQNISLKEFQMCARFRRKKLKKAVYTAGQQIKSITREINLYDYLIEQYKKEKQKIAQHLENLRCTIERSLLLREQEPINSDTPQEVIQKLWRERNDMLGVLLELLHIDFDALDIGQRASIVSLDGYDKLTRFDSLFRKEAPSLSSLMDYCVKYIDSEEESDELSSTGVALKDFTKHELYVYQPYTPGQRPLGRNYIIDVESGTSIYFSSSRGDPEFALDEEQAAAANDDEEQGTSESGSEAEDTKTKETAQEIKTQQPLQPTKAPIEAASLPPGTIVDVVTEEEFEEEPMPDEYVEENEEYDINLFY